MRGQAAPLQVSERDAAQARLVKAIEYAQDHSLCIAVLEFRSVLEELKARVAQQYASQHGLQVGLHHIVAVPGPQDVKHSHDRLSLHKELIRLATTATAIPSYSPPCFSTRFRQGSTVHVFVSMKRSML